MKLRPDLTHENAPRLGIHCVTSSNSRFSAVGMTRVRCVERASEPGPEIAEDLLILPLCIDFGRGIRLPARSEECRRTASSHEVRKAFVEYRLSGRVKRVVSDFVDHRVREIE